MSEQEKSYVKGFNNGYLLAKYLPDLLAKLLKNITPSNDYLSGFFSGKEEYDFEYLRTQLNELDQLRNLSKDREKDFEKDL